MLSGRDNNILGLIWNNSPQLLTLAYKFLTQSIDSITWRYSRAYIHKAAKRLNAKCCEVPKP